MSDTDDIHAPDGDQCLRLKLLEGGFLRGEFADLNEGACSIQESGMADEAAIWVGYEREMMQPLPKHRRGTQMHLDRKMARKLGAMLMRFADTGELE